MAIAVRGCDMYVWERKAGSYDCFAEDCTWHAETKRGEARTPGKRSRSASSCCVDNTREAPEESSLNSAGAGGLGIEAFPNKQRACESTRDGTISV